MLLCTDVLQNMFSTLVSLNGTTTYQFHRIRGGGFVWVDISCASGIRDSFPKRFEARHGCIFHYLVDMGQFQSMLQVPFNERSGQQALLSKKTPDEASLGLGHDLLLPGKGFDVLSNIFSGNVCILENVWHFCKLGFQGVRYSDVTLHNAKEGLISNGGQDLILSEVLVVV